MKYGLKNKYFQKRQRFLRKLVITFKRINSYIILFKHSAKRKIVSYSVSGLYIYDIHKYLL